MRASLLSDLEFLYRAEAYSQEEHDWIESDRLHAIADEIGERALAQTETER